MSILARLNLIRAEGRKRAQLLRRYPLDTLSQILIVYIFFIVIFFGGRLLVGAAISNNIEGLIVGYFIWTLSFGAYSSLATNMTKEAEWGTLEQIYMSSHGFGSIIQSKLVIILLETFGIAAVVLLSLVLTTGVSIELNMATVFIISILTVSSAAGVGFVVGGLAIVYKKIDNFVNIMQFGFIGLISAPSFVDSPLINILPLTLGTKMLQRAMTDGVLFWEFGADLLLLVSKAALYLFFGYFVLKKFVDIARNKAVLGHY